MVVRKCDRCKKIIAEHYDIQIKKTDEFGWKYTDTLEMELCENCYKELCTWLKKGEEDV